jgi:transposase
MHEVFVGIDISKNFFNVSIVNRRGEEIKRFNFDMDIYHFNKLLEELNKFNKKSIIVGMESSGVYHMNLYFFLRENSFNVSLINPLIISSFTKLSLRKSKTDRKDAKEIAKYLLMVDENINYFESNEIKYLVRERERISKEIGRIKNDIEKIIIVTFPEIIKFYNIYNKTLLNLIKDYPSSNRIREVSYEEIEDILNKNRRGRKSKISSKRIIELAKSSIGISSEVKERILSFKISHLLFLMDKEREIEEIIRRNIDGVMRRNIEIVTSIKGIGEVSAIHLLSEICDINRFNSYKKLIAYSGFDPTIYQSGNFEGRSRISKRGNRHIRRILWIIANSVIRYNEVFKIYFIKKIDKGIPYKKAVISVCHKLIRVIYSLIKNGSYFDPNFHLVHNSL